jgi:hypothetical protein
MVEEIEELAFEAERHPFADGKLPTQIKIAPGEVRSARRVASKIAELAIPRRFLQPGRVGEDEVEDFENCAILRASLDELIRYAKCDRGVVP